MNVNKSIGSENLFQDGSAKEIKDFFFRNHKSQIVKHVYCQRQRRYLAFLKETTIVCNLNNKKGVFP